MPAKLHPIKNFLSCFLIKFHAFMLTSSCFHTHAFILSCFMSSCSRFQLKSLSLVTVCQAAPHQKFQSSCFLFKFHAFMLTSSYILSYSCLHTFMLHVFMLTLSCFMLI